MYSGNVQSSNLMKLKAFLFLFYIILASYIARTQAIYSKDKVYLGELEEFMTYCVQEATSRTINLQGIEMDINDYCRCSIQEVMSSLFIAEIEEAVKKNTMQNFLMREDIIELISKCVQAHANIDDSFKLSQIPSRDTLIYAGIIKCTSELMNTEGAQDVWTKELAEEYCRCAIEKIYDGEYSYGEIQNIDQVHSVAQNEIGLPCIPEEIIVKYSNFENTYHPSNIIGKESQTAVRLIRNPNNTYKAKIRLGSSDLYIVIDTGASDLIIGTNLFYELLNKGDISLEDYQGAKWYTLANGALVKAMVFKIRNVRIGEYIVLETFLSVVDDSLPLLGAGFLNNFKNWNLKANEDLLILSR